MATYDEALARAIEDVKASHAVLDTLVAERKRTMTQATMADAIGVSISTIANFESEMSNPKFSMVQRYARVLGLKVVATLE